MDESVKLKLLAGLPFNIDNICILKPLTLLEIASVGYDKYNLYLSNLVADVSDFKIPNIDLTQYSYWDILISNMYHADEEYSNMILNAMKLFLKEDIFFARCTCLFYIRNNKQYKIIDKNIFELIRNNLKIQNCVDKNDNEEFKPANSKAEEIRQKILKGRQKINGSNNISFEDLVSTLAANGNGLNISNIWNLTIYQFNNQFARMQMIEDYDINIRQLLAGAKKEDVQLKHYIRPIESKK